MTKFSFEECSEEELDKLDCKLSDLLTSVTAMQKKLTAWEDENIKTYLVLLKNCKIEEC